MCTSRTHPPYQPANHATDAMALTRKHINLKRFNVPCYLLSTDGNLCIYILTAS